MTVKVILKEPAPNGMKEFVYRESAVLDDSGAGYAVLSAGKVIGGRAESHLYLFKDDTHIVYAWHDIERLEITP